MLSTMAVNLVVDMPRRLASATPSWSHDESSLVNHTLGRPGTGRHHRAGVDLGTDDSIALMVMNGWCRYHLDVDRRRPDGGWPSRKT